MRWGLSRSVVCLSVCLSVTRLFCAKTAERADDLFGVIDAPAGHVVFDRRPMPPYCTGEEEWQKVRNNYDVNSDFLTHSLDGTSESMRPSYFITRSFLTKILPKFQLTFLMCTCRLR